MSRILNYYYIYITLPTIDKALLEWCISNLYDIQQCAGKNENAIIVSCGVRRPGGRSVSTTFIRIVHTSTTYPRLQTSVLGIIKDHKPE